MRKLIPVIALSALIATVAYAGNTPGTGILNSPHDMNTVTGLAPDNQGRACAFCHTPHHAVDLAGQYNPLWSHQPTALAGVTPYMSPTFDAGNSALIDPLIGPSRLCMSCHDGAIAPDQHYGSANVTHTGRFASDTFAGYPSAVKNIAVGLGGNFGNDHPIGFDIKASNTDKGIFVNEFKSSEEFHYLDLSKVDMKILKDSIVKESYEGLLFIPKTDSIQTLKNKIQYLFPNLILKEEHIL